MRLPDGSSMKLPRRWTDMDALWCPELAGLESVSGGEIEIGGEVVNEREPKDRNIAMVFQNYALYSHMSVFNNMAYGLKNRGMPREGIRAKVVSTRSYVGT
ncbi:MAG: hypothetical protein HOI95_11195 [Chromatiales bacterium]|nr:hypothetical protein [Chromatiales bacterium]